MITPAISVLSAAEGLKVATPALADYVVLLIGHFILQSWGSARIGAYFGPVMALWFTALAVAVSCGTCCALGATRARRQGRQTTTLDFMRKHS
jgi:K+ transporter